jgi:general secretion pathway protein A
MYAPYFGLSHEPFSIAPDPRYLFMSERHREALAHLLYGLGGGGGFVLLTGEIGTGKTTVCRCFLEQVPPNCQVAYVFNPKLSALELLQVVCQEFGVTVPERAGGASVKDHVDALNAFLLASHAQGRNSVLVIDEAQNLSADVLEQLRLLTNLETNERKLLQIVLIGQPELRGVLARPELEQLAQRVIARYHLQALSVQETAQYVRYRLEVAGLSRAVPFEPRALALIHKLTAGVPRRINLLCDRSLLGAYARSEPAVTPAIVRQAAREVFGEGEGEAPVKVSRLRPAVALGVGLAVGGAAVFAALQLARRDAAPALAATGAQAPATMAARGASDAAQAAPAAAPASAPAVAAAAGATSTPVLLDSEQQAWRELAKAWQADVGADGDACRLLARQDLQCFPARATPLALIRQLDRPGIVTLDRASGRPRYAILAGVADGAATLVAGGTVQTVTLAALASRWSGEWATLWRAPAGVDPNLRETGGTLAWVQQHLPANEAGEKTPLSVRLRQFQLAQGLPADGVLGPMTLMQLNRLAGVDEPRLKPKL